MNSLMGKFIKNNFGLIIVSLAYLAIFLYMLPLHDQTYQDDWAYILTVKHYLESGILRINEWSATSFIFPTFWGTLFSKVLGYSPKILHLSTVALFYPALLCFYSLLKRLGLSTFRSIVFTLFLMSYPWILMFNYSFLSDVPYISLLIISSYFYARGLQDKLLLGFVLGSIFSGLAFLTRQLGVTPFAAVILMLLYKSLSEKRIYIKEIIATLFPFLTLTTPYLIWSENPENMTIAQHHYNFTTLKTQTFPYLSPFNIKRIGVTHSYYAEYIKRALYYFHHLAPFFAPLALFFLPEIKKIAPAIKKYYRAIIVTFIIYLVTLFIDVYFHTGRLAYSLNIPTIIISNDNIAPFSLYNNWEKIVYFSTAVCLTISAVIIYKTISRYFSKISPKPFITKVFTFLSLSLFVYYFCAVFYNIAPHLPPFAGFTVYLNTYIKTLFSFNMKQAISSSWIVLLALEIAVLLSYLFIAKYRLKLKIHDNCALLNMFLIITLVMQFVSIWLVMYFYWAQYMIANVPLIILIFAYGTKGLKIRNFSTLAVIILLIIFSVNLTKRRYVNLGFQWELGSQLVSMGIAPVNISIGEESWMRYWYAENTLAEKIRAKGGNKFSIYPINTWTEVVPTPGISYSITEVNPLFSNNDSNYQIILDSGIQPYSIFSKTRFIVYKNESGKEP